MQRSTKELENELPHILDSPSDVGEIEMIAARPAPGERNRLATGRLDTELGLVGDNWKERGSRHRPDGRANPDAQVTLMNSRVARAISTDGEDWILAGDQIYVDLDLSVENLPAGSRLQIGDAIVELSEQPHTGCAKFVERFGRDALRFVNVGQGKEFRLRGANCSVVSGGEFKVGGKVRKLNPN